MFTFCVQAQVGIGTQDPTRTLDVNGNVRVTTYLDKSNDYDYPNIVASNSDGNLDFIRKQSIPQNPNMQVEVGRVIYITAPSTYITDYKWAKCGDIRVRLSYNQFMEIQGISNLSNNSALLGIERWNSNGTYGYEGTNASIFSSLGGNFTPPAASNVINAVHPVTGDLYRMTFSVTKNSATTNNYSAICERFYNGQ